MPPPQVQPLEPQLAPSFQPSTLPSPPSQLQQEGEVQPTKPHWFYLRPGEKYWIPFSHTDSSGLVWIQRQTTGRYRARFAGVSAVTEAYGNVQVTSYGDDASFCQVASWVGDDVWVQLHRRME